jgi:hypothetical protein
MSDISGNFSVTLGRSSNSWASGALNTSNQTYKGQTYTSANLSPTSVGWTVTLNHGGTDCTVVFSGGQYSAGPPAQITNGTAQCSCFVSPSEDDIDSWSAASTGTDDAARKAGSYK